MKAKRIIVLTVIFSLLLLTGCLFNPHKLKGDWMIAGDSEHFNYYFLEGKLTIEKEEEINNALARLEEFWGKTAPIWSLPEDLKINYYKFKDREQIKELTNYNVRGKALLGKNTVYSDKYADAHEVSHIISTYHITSAKDSDQVNVSNFWLEGIAMYYTWPGIYFEEPGTDNPNIGTWQGHPVHFYAKKYLNEGTLPDLKAFVYGNEAFDAEDDEVAYCTAGSFVTYLIGENHSHPEKVKKYKKLLYQVDKCNSTEEVLTAFENTFEITFDDAVEGWKLFLKSNSWQ